MDLRDEEDRGALRWGMLIVVLAVALVFGSACTNEFVSWDDRHNFEQNPRLMNPAQRDLGWFWREPYKDLYVPVTSTVWGVVGLFAQTRGEDGRLHPNPYVFHTVNVAVHAASAVL